MEEFSTIRPYMSSKVCMLLSCKNKFWCPPPKKKVLKPKQTWPYITQNPGVDNNQTVDVSGGFNDNLKKICQCDLIFRACSV